LEQLYLLMGQGEGGFSNQSPGSISQDPVTDGMGVEGNQGDYRFSPPVSRAEVDGGSVDTSGFLQKLNNLSDVSSNAGANANLGVPFSLGAYTKTTYLTPGSFTHTFAGSSTVYMALIAGASGGGGGGSTGVASGKIAGGGGGGGASAFVSGRVNVASLTVVIGTGGSAGALDGNGTNGGDSSVAHGSYTFDARGGLAGGANGTAGDGGDVPTTTNSVTADYFLLGLSGESGRNGAVRSVTFNGAGAVSAYTSVGGRGGKVAIFASLVGGIGGSPGGTGAVGSNGKVVIYER
jgi:hypothetical protein